MKTMTSEPLFEAINRNDVATATLLLKSDPGLASKFSTQDKRRSFPLHIAARSSGSAIIRLLIEAGAGPNTLDSEGTSPLGVAAFIGNAEAARELVAFGAHLSIRNSLGFTPLLAARFGARGSWKNYSSAKPSDWGEVAQILQENGAIA